MRRGATGAVVASIVLLAAYLRLSRLDLVPFGGDQAGALAIAKSFLETGQVPLVGGRYSMLGIYTSPVLHYIMAIPLLLSPNPAVATGVVGLAGVVAVFLTYRFAARHLGVAEGLVAALLFAASFWAVFYSRKILDIGFHPLFALLFISSLFGMVLGRKPKAAAWALLWLSLLLQFHLAAMPFILILGLALILFRRRFQARYLDLGILLFVLANGPWLLWEVTHDFYNVRLLLSLPAAPTAFDLSSFQYAIHLISTSGYTTFFGPPSAQVLTAPPGIGILRDGLALLFGAGLLYLAAVVVRERAKSPRAQGYLLLLLWFFVPTLFYLQYTPPPQVHRFLMLYPVQFLVIGIVVGQVFARLRGAASQGWPPALTHSAAALMVLFLGMAVATQVYAFQGFNDWLDTKSTVPGYGIPLKYQQKAVERAEAWSRAHDAGPVFIASHGELTDALGYLAHGQLHATFFDDRQAFVLPQPDARPILYLTTSDAAPAAALLANRFSAFQVDAILHPGAADAFRFYALPLITSDTAWPPGEAQRLPLVMDNGLRIWAYELDLRAEGLEAALTLYWQVDEAPKKGSEYCFFHHVVDNAGQGWGDWDGIGYGAGDWRPGDRVVSWHRIPVVGQPPRGQYWLEWGMYDLREGRRVAFLDARSGRRADALRLGPVKLGGQEPSAARKPPARQRFALFGGQLALLGYDLEMAGELTLRLHWQAQVPPRGDYVAFVHLLDGAGRLVWQKDSPPLNGMYPTSMWDEGEVVEEEYQLPLPLPGSGPYFVEVGWYRPATLERLTAVEPGQTAQTAVRLPLEVP